MSTVISRWKERPLAMFTWRSLVWSAVAALSLLAGLPTDLNACCFSWLFGCCGGPCGYGTGYGGYYYGGGYYGGYVPSYGGCSSCGPSCAPCGYGYASAGIGCSPCAGGNCGVTSPSTTPSRPTPDDGFRSGSGSSPAENAPAEPPPSGRRRPRTYAPEESPATGGTSGTTSNPRNDGLDSTRGRSRTSPDSSPSRDDDSFDEPLRKKNDETSSDPFNVKKPANTKANGAKSVPVPDDDFPADEPTNSTKTKANKPALGTPSESHEKSSTTDGDNSSDTVIPQKKPAPVELPAEEEVAPKPEMPDDLKLDESSTSAAVAPKVRQVLSGRVDAPRIVRLKLRPNSQWLATSKAPVIAKH
jgi:hypothetical protein